MKKAPFLITLSLFVLVAGGFFVYQYFFKHRPTAIWELVPKQAILVYEANDCATCVPAESANVGSLLKKIMLDVEGQDSIKKNLEFLFASKKGQAISLHVTSKDNFDFVYYFVAGQSKQFEAIINAWKTSKSIRYSDRELNGFHIYEYSFGKKIFSCVKLGDGWAGSFTPFLIEDVVRAYEIKNEQLFSNAVNPVYSLPHIKEDAGDVYLNLENLSQWLTVFPEHLTSDIKKLGQAGLLDIKEDKTSVTLNGFSLIAPGDNTGLLAYFKNQTPVPFTIKQYISNETAFAMSYGISDGNALYQKLDIATNKNVLDSLNDFVRIEYANLFSSFSKEMVICLRESKAGNFSTVVVFETQKPAEWLKAFDMLSEAASKEDTVFHEQYSTYRIREIGIPNFAEKLFKPLVQGFSQTYYSSIGNYIILAENVEDLKIFLNDIDQENVWGKSVAVNKFLESTLLESNISLYVNTPLVWSTLTNKLNPRWKKFIQENQSLVNSFDLGAVQFSHLNESFYTNVTWTYTPVTQKKSNDRPEKPSNRLVASLGSTIISKPVVLRSHVNHDNEVLVQDSAYVLYHLSSDGKILWQKELGERIIGEIHQVDFFANGKLQFFFATKNQLHVIDRLGNYVAPYPQEIKIKDIEYVSLVDYDNSKKYRFLLGDKSGKLWMFDKECKNLEGWNPKNLDDNLFAAPRHYRIRGKDYILGIRRNGFAYLMTRRGEDIKGFPLDLEARPEGDYYLETGSSLATTQFVCVSRDGFRIRFNLEGKILNRETLIKASYDTRFGLVAEQSKKSYIITRQDSKRLTLLNEEGTEIVTNDFVGSNPVDVKYYNFGAGKIYYTITDLNQELSFIYDGKGVLLNATPITGNSLELRPSRNAMPKTFVVDQNALIIQ